MSEQEIVLEHLLIMLSNKITIQQTPLEYDDLVLLKTLTERRLELSQTNIH